MNAQEMIEAEAKYTETFKVRPEMPYPMPMEEFYALIVQALEDGQPIPFDEDSEMET